MMRSRMRQAGNALVESALILPLLIGAALIIGDLYSISLARANLEQSAHSIATTLAMQNRLDRDGLQALIDQTASPDSAGNYELIISKVGLDRRLGWKPIYRGTVQNLCPGYATGSRYNGELPEEAPADSDDDSASRISILVVQLCRHSSDLPMTTGLLPDKNMQVMAFSRMVYNDVDLDEYLTGEAGLDDDDS